MSPEYTYHFQRVAVAAIGIKAIIETAQSTSGAVVLRGDSKGHETDLQLLLQSGVQYRDERTNKSEALIALTDLNA